MKLIRDVPRIKGTDRASCHLFTGFTEAENILMKNQKIKILDEIILLDFKIQIYKYQKPLKNC